MDSSPDTERAECVSTRGGDRSDQGLVANAAGQDCRQASQLRDLLAQNFWQLKTNQTIDFEKKKDMRLGNLIFCQKTQVNLDLWAITILSPCHGRDSTPPLCNQESNIYFWRNHKKLFQWGLISEGVLVVGFVIWTKLADGSKHKCRVAIYFLNSLNNSTGQCTQFYPRHSKHRY